MPQRHKVTGRNPAAIWLMIILFLLLAFGATGIVFLIAPAQQLERQAQVTASARQATIDQQYAAGLAFVAASDWPAAADAFRQVIALDAGFKDTQVQLSYALAEATGQAALARVDATAMTQANATATAQAGVNAIATAQTLPALYARGQGLMNLGRWSEAQTALQAVFDVDPTYQEVQNLLLTVSAQLTPTPVPMPLAPLTPPPRAVTLGDLRQVNSANLPSCGPPAPEAVPVNDRQGLYNLALLSQANATASSLIPGFAERHQIQFLNDGWYNNCRSWIPERMPAWIEIDLGDEFLIGKVVFGSEHTAHFRDRAATLFSIKVATQKEYPSRWLEVVSYDRADKPVAGTTIFEFEPAPARYVRLELYAANAGNVRVDEVEIYGKN